MNSIELEVVHIIPSPKGGGAEFLVREMNKRLQSYGVKSSAIYFTKPDDYQLSDNEFCLNLKSPRSPLAILKLRLTIKKFLNKKKYLILHAHLTWPLYYTILATFDKSIFRVYTEHSTHNKRRVVFLLSFIEKYIYKKYDKIICISKGVKDRLKTWLGDEQLFIDKLEIIFNGATLKKYIDTRSIQKNKITIVSVGSLYKHKGFDLGISSINKIKNKIESYNIVGKGPEIENLKSIVNDLNLEDKVNFIGWSDNVEKYYHEADIALIPSRWEGFGLVAVEALSTGLPVVASNIEGLSEIFDEQTPHYLFEPGNVDDVVKGVYKIEELITSDSGISTRARKTSEKFTIDKMVRKYSELYRQLLSNE